MRFLPAACFLIPLAAWGCTASGPPSRNGESAMPPSSDEAPEKNESADPGTPDESGVRPPPDRMEQTAGPGTGEAMDRMEEAGEAVVARFRGADDPGPAYRQGALEILWTVRPVFGPANAWAFNLRDRLLVSLAETLGLEPEEALATLDPAAFDEAVRDLEILVEALHAASFETRVEGANRTAVLWSPAPGFALHVIDPSLTVEWRPPYAGTPAGPDAPKVQRHPEATLFLSLPEPGEAVQNMVAREQPGDPLFLTGGLVSFLLQEPQSQDVYQDAVLKRILDVVGEANLLRMPAPAALEALRAALPADARLTVPFGLPTVASAESPDSVDLSGLDGTAVHWTVVEGIDVVHHLLFPGTR